MREALWVMMTQVPAISRAAFATFDLKLQRVVRRPDGQVIRDTVSLADLPRGLERFRELQTSHVTFWGALFWNDVLHQPVLNVRTPIRRIDDAFIGGLIATVAVGDLSYLIGERARAAAAATSSWSGDDKVLAHRRLVDPRGLGLSEDKPLPTIKEVDDPVLARIWIRRSAARRSTGRWAISAMSSRPRGGAGCSSTARSPATAPSPGWSGSTFRSRTPPATSTG